MQIFMLMYGGAEITNCYGGAERASSGEDKSRVLLGMSSNRKLDFYVYRMGQREL